MFLLRESHLQQLREQSDLAQFPLFLWQQFSRWSHMLHWSFGSQRVYCSKSRTVHTCMASTEEFQYINNIYSTRSRTPMVTTTSRTNLEVLRQLEYQAQLPRKPRAVSNVNRRRDHLVEMWQGMTYGSRNNNSAYRLYYQQTPEMKETVANVDLSHHIKRDFIKEYTEAMCRHRGNLRPIQPRK